MSSTDAEQIGGCGQSRPHLPHDYVIQMDGAMLPASCHGIEAPLPEGATWESLGQALLVLEGEYGQLLGVEGAQIWPAVGERLRSAIAVDSILEQAGIIERGRTGAYKLAELYRRGKASMDTLVKQLEVTNWRLAEEKQMTEGLDRQCARMHEIGLGVKTELEQEREHLARAHQLIAEQRGKIAELERELLTRPAADVPDSNEDRGYDEPADRY